MLKSYLQKNKMLWMLCIFTGLVALVFLPVTIADRLPIPGQTTVFADKSILSYQPTASYEPPTYLVCSIDDDPENYNNYGMYHPLELAVTINNLRELGIKHLFLGTHLHWPDLDTQDNGTLNSAISNLDSCIISVPLRPTVGAIEIPDYLLATSISAETVKGDIKDLTKVNNLSLVPTFIIPENTQVGFSQIEKQDITRKIPLLALWDDRVILSSLLLERMHHLKIKPSDLVIHMGDNIMLGDSGNTIPIDKFGYFSPNDYPADVEPDIISTHITTLKKSPIDTTNAILTAAGLKADSYRAINQPVTQLNQLTLTPVVSYNKVCNRAHFLIQLAALLVVIFLLITAQSMEGKKNLLWIILLVLFCVGLAAVVARASSYYLVITHLILAILTASLYRFIIVKRDEGIAESNQGYIDFDEVSNSFKKSKISTPNAKVASKKRKRDRRKNARKKRAEKKRSQKNNSN